MNTKHALVALLVLLACLFVHTTRADLSVHQGSLVLIGGIAKGDDGVALDLLAEHADVTRVIIMWSNGGSASAGLGLGELFAARDLPVYVTGPCASACSLAAIGGKPTLLVGPEANLAVHSPVLPVEAPKEMVPASFQAVAFDVAFMLLRDGWAFARRELGEERGNLFAWLTYGTPRDGLHWLTVAEQAALGLQTLR